MLLYFLRGVGQQEPEDSLGLGLGGQGVSHQERWGLASCALRSRAQPASQPSRARHGARARGGDSALPFQPEPGMRCSSGGSGRGAVGCMGPQDLGQAVGQDWRLQPACEKRMYLLNQGKSSRGVTSARSEAKAGQLRSLPENSRRCRVPWWEGWWLSPGWWSPPSWSKTQQCEKEDSGDTTETRRQKWAPFSEEVQGRWAWLASISSRSQGPQIHHHVGA